MKTRFLAILLIVMTAFSTLAATQALAVAVDVDALADPALDQRARVIARQLRCLVCQNQSIEDSNADLARDLRQLVRDRLKAGDSDDQVIAYIVARYGDWVLLNPPVNPRTYLLWAAPILIAALGLILTVRRRRNTRLGPSVPLSADESARLQEILGDQPPR
jgi:cytochrome c-type biogenesis protein CcmH